MNDVSASNTTETAVVRTFLIADVRGYTQFTQEHGDEAAALLASTFASLVRSDVEASGGDVVESRGDEVLAVFSSARQALKAAVGLQRRFNEKTQAPPSFPLSVGIGLDAGEAVPIDGGYRGGALNLASRLCSLAESGQVLASDTVVHLGRAIPGIRYVELAPRRVKGFDDLIRVVQVMPESAPREESAGSTMSNRARPSLPRGGFLGAVSDESLIGRRDDLERCLAALSDVQQGNGRLILLTGEPGIGKTRLAQEIGAEAYGRDFLLGAGACSEQRQMAPLFPFLDPLTSLYRGSPAGVKNEILSTWPILGRLLPDLGTLPPAPSSNGQEEHVKLLRAIADFLRIVASASPVALMLDDLQWADTASIDLFEYLARSTRTAPVLLLGTYRSPDVDRDHPLYRALMELDRQRVSDVITLGRLDAQETGLLIASTIGAVRCVEALTAMVQEKTEGNPFFVREVARALVERGDLSRQDGLWIIRNITEIQVPERVRAVIEQRLSRLDESVRILLREISVLGQQFSFDEAQRLTQKSEEQVEEGLQLATTVGLVIDKGDDQFVFEHGLTQAALYADLSPRRRRRLHLSAAEALENSPGAEKRTAELAWHFLQADDARRGIPYAIQAADHAQQVFAYGQAEKLYRAALDMLWERGAVRKDDNGWVDDATAAQVLEKLGSVLRTVGHYDEALEALERAARDYSTDNNIEGERRAVALIAQIYTLQGHPAESIARLQPVIDTARGGDSTRGMVLVRLELAQAMNETGAFEDALHAAERAGRAARDISDDKLLAGSEVLRAAALGMLGRYTEARRVFESAIPTLDNPSVLIDALNGMGAYSVHAGQFEQSRAYHERALRLSDEIGDPRAVAVSKLYMGGALFRLGKWKEARSEIDGAASVSHSLDLPWLVGYTDMARAALDIYEGASESARLALQSVIESADHDRDIHRSQQAHWYLAEAEDLANKLHAARTHLEPFIAHPDLSPYRTTVVDLSLARVLLGQGEIAAAEETLSRAMARATSDHNRPAFMEALWIRALLREQSGSAEEARRLFGAAITLARDMSHPFMEARILQSWGEMEGGQGDTEIGTHRLLAALEIYTRLGAQPFIAQVDALLPAARRPEVP